MDNGIFATLHRDIMNLPCAIPFPEATEGLKLAYKKGHRNARHAAAELVTAAAATAEQSSTPAPRGGGTIPADATLIDEGAKSAAPAVPEGVDTAELPPSLPLAAMLTGRNLESLSVWYSEAQMREFGAQQREAGRREGQQERDDLAAEVTVLEAALATRRPVSALTDEQIAGIMGWRGPGAYTADALRKIREVLAASPKVEPTDAEPVAYTAQSELDEIRREPRAGRSMWGKRNENNAKDIPLFLHPAAPVEPVSDDKRDAERYRKLRSPNRGMSGLSSVTREADAAPFYELKCGDELDAAVDALATAQPQTGT